MRRMIMLLAVLVLLCSVASCGVDAARKAGERASHGTKAEGVRKNAGRPDGTGPRTRAPEKTSAAPFAGGGETTGPAEERAQTTGHSSDAARPVLDAKWYKDSDGNYVPDFVEVKEGYDPKKDDCALKGSCPGSAGSIDFYTEPKNALLLLDSSGSMAADDGTGRSKMEAAKEAILRYSGVVSVVYNTGFAVFGNTGDATAAGKRQSCRDAANMLLPLGKVNGSNFKGVVDRFQPTGWTPIAGALREAGRAFSGKKGQYNRVILVSDGIETCGGDPVAAAEELHQSGIGVTVDVVGFGVSGDESGQLEDIAAAGGGQYYDAKTGADLDAYFNKQAEAMGKTVDAASCWINKGYSATNCDLGLCNQTAFNYIGPEQLKYKYGSPEWNAFEKLKDRIYAGQEEREKAYKEARDKGYKLLDQYDKMFKEYNRAMQQAYGGG